LRRFAAFIEITMLRVRPTLRLAGSEKAFGPFAHSGRVRIRIEMPGVAEKFQVFLPQRKSD